jgi:hypothetical protein
MELAVPELRSRFFLDSCGFAWNFGGLILIVLRLGKD